MLNPHGARLFLRVLGALGVKKPFRHLLRKMSNLFLYDCEDDRIDHDDFKDSNFVDDGQPEIAVSPPTLEVFLSPNV